VADKPDSHDICFIADGDTRGFLADRLGTERGPIVDESGEVVGGHEGAYGFTIGQRKGLRIDRPAPDGRPRYVLSIEPVSNTVTVGPRSSLQVTSIVAERPVWNGPVDEPREPLACMVQLRAHGEVYGCRAQLSGGEVHITLDSPATGVAAGQAAVLYLGDTVIGSATIASAS
jgi:tRNA-uridine 2-sulfurtransferase